MSRGYPVSVTHRLGGHDGPTEWEVSIPGASGRDLGRLHILQELGSPHLVAWTVEADRYAPGLSIAEGAPEGLVWRVAAFLTAWPDEAPAALAALEAALKAG